MGVQVTQAATFSIAKGLNHLHNAKQYFEDVLVEMPSSNTKNFFNPIINKLDWCQKQFLMKIKTQESKDALKEEMANAATLDSLLNIVISLPEPLRLQVEEFASKVSEEYQKYKQ